MCGYCKNPPQDMSNGNLEKLRILHNFTFTPHQHHMAALKHEEKLVPAFGVSLHRCCGTRMTLQRGIKYLD